MFDTEYWRYVLVILNLSNWSAVLHYSWVCCVWSCVSSTLPTGPTNKLNSVNMNEVQLMFASQSKSSVVMDLAFIISLQFKIWKLYIRSILFEPEVNISYDAVFPTCLSFQKVLLYRVSPIITAPSAGRVGEKQQSWLLRTVRSGSYSPIWTTNLTHKEKTHKDRLCGWM